MRVFVTGATGVYGHRIVSQLSDSGHDVVGLTRSADGRAVVERHGGDPVTGDLLDRDALASALDGRDVDAVVHAATRLPPVTKTDAAYWERNDRVRVDGAENLLAVLGDDVDRFVFPSVAWVARQPDGSAFDETAERHPDRSTQSAADVEDLLDEASDEFGFEVTVLRNGFFYGSDCRHTRTFAENLLAGDLPIVGGGLLGRRDATFSLIHADDAASAVAAAVDADVSGRYHVVDDDPVPVADYLSTFAEVLDAPEPSRFPWWLVRPLAGKDLVRFMTSSFPTTNEKFRRATGWEPAYPTYRDGLDAIVETWRADGTLAALRAAAEGDEDAGTVPAYREGLA